MRDIGPEAARVYGCEQPLQKDGGNAPNLFSRR